jgi:hypothetical protein
MTDSLLHDLAVLHSQGSVDETAVRYVFGERVQGKPLELDHLVMMFGPEDIDRIFKAMRSHPADRVLLRSRLEDIVETLRAVNAWDGGTSYAIAGIVAANLKLVTVLRDVLCPPTVEQDPVAALDAAFPQTTDRQRDAP